MPIWGVADGVGDWLNIHPSLVAKPILGYNQHGFVTLYLNAMKAMLLYEKESNNENVCI